jgi:hypothetical protein
MREEWMMREVYSMNEGRIYEGSVDEGNTV